MVCSNFLISFDCFSIISLSSVEPLVPEEILVLALIILNILIK